MAEDHHFMGHELLRRLREVSSVSALERFAASTKPKDHFGRALVEYAREQAAHLKQNGVKDFNHSTFLTADLSGVEFRGAPVIFLGTNDWALRRFWTLDELKRKTHNVAARVQEAVSSVNGKVHLLVVPEKDVLLRALFTQPDKPLETAVSAFLSSATPAGGHNSFLEFSDQLQSRAKWSDYYYADSHLLARDYLRIFLRILEGFGLLGYASGDIALTARDFFGDFASKFPQRPAHEPILSPYFPNTRATVTEGSATFEPRLSDTWQCISNPEAPVKAHLAIYGDSHCSILDARRLTYMFAATFERCTFRWDPFRLNKPVAREDADFALFEISQRFLFS